MFKNKLLIAIGITLGIGATMPALAISEEDKFLINCRISPKMSNRVLNVRAKSPQDGAQLEIYSKKNQLNQKFTLAYKSNPIGENNGNWYITAMHSGKCMALEYPEDTTDTRVKQYRCTKDDYWQIERVDSRYHKIKSPFSNKYWDVEGNRNENKRSIQTHKWKNGDNQKFEFTECKDMSGGGFTLY
jgi:hypothetical protein